MLHVMGLTLDEGAEVDDDALRFVALALRVLVVADKVGEFLLVLLAVTLEFFGDFLLHDEGLEGVVALLFGARELRRELAGFGFVLLDELGKTVIFLLVLLNFGLEVRGLLGELRGKGLEFLKLSGVLGGRGQEDGGRRTCCFQLSTSSRRKLFLLLTFCTSVSMRPFRLI